MTSIVSSATVEKIRELNQTRNAFSHSSALSELQSSAAISECYAEVLEILDAVKRLSDAKLYRYRSHLDGLTIRCEPFNGHGLTRTIVNLSLEHIQAPPSLFRSEEALLLFSNQMFSLRPFIFFRDDASGHATRLFRFRRAFGEHPNRMISFASLSDGLQVDAPREDFATEINALRLMLGLGPD